MIKLIINKEVARLEKYYNQTLKAFVIDKDGQLEAKDVVRNAMEKDLKGQIEKLNHELKLMNEDLMF